MLLSLAAFTTPVSAQARSPWIRQAGYVAYMWPSFLQLQDRIAPADLTGYSIKGSDHAPGALSFGDCAVTQQEALSAALMLMGGKYEIGKYGIATDKPNIIPYHGGAILYGYWKEKKRWEVFNIQSNDLIEHGRYHRFDVVKK